MFSLRLKGNAAQRDSAARPEIKNTIVIEDIIDGIINEGFSGPNPQVVYTHTHTAGSRVPVN